MIEFQQFFYIAVSVLVAVTIHEAAHAWVADRLGDPTAKHQGRISLNPFDHLDFAGTLLFLFIGFGWGKPVPVNASNFRNPWRDSMIVAAAGPISNIFLAALLSFFLRIFDYYGVEDGNYFLSLVSFAFQINITLAIFNLLPIPPLDGSKIFPLFVPLRYREYYYLYLANASRYFIFFILFDMFVIAKLRGGESFLGTFLRYAVTFVENVILLGS